MCKTIYQLSETPGWFWKDDVDVLVFFFFPEKRTELCPIDTPAVTLIYLLLVVCTVQFLTITFNLFQPLILCFKLLESSNHISLRKLRLGCEEWRPECRTKQKERMLRFCSSFAVCIWRIFRNLLTCQMFGPKIWNTWGMQTYKYEVIWAKLGLGSYALFTF